MRDELLTTAFFERAFDLYPDLVGVVADDGTSYTYGEVEERVNRLAGAFERWGLSKGDRVAVLAPNAHWYVETLFAIQHLGLVIVPLNYRLTASEYGYLLDDCEPAALLADAAFAEEIAPVRDDVGVEHSVAYDADETTGSWLDYERVLAEQSPTAPPRPDVSEDDVSAICYTSGSTGDPKGVVRTHRNEFTYVQCQLHHQDVRDGEVYLWTLPMFHVNGWGFTYGTTATGGTHVCLREFDPAAVFDRIRRYDVTHLCGAATMLERLVDHHREHGGPSTGDAPLRVTTAGSSPPKELLEALEAELGWDVIHIYGATETGTISTSNDRRRLAAGDPLEITQRQGLPTLGTEMRVVDEDGEDVPRDDETLGEIVVRGGQVTGRYWNEPGLTEEAFHDRVDGWFHTGDLATVDERGMILVRDRKKNVIISGGENVSSAEVEGVLRGHPDVEEVAVVGVPSQEWGETPLAMVVRRDGGAVTGAGLIAYARETLAGYKCPTAVEFVESLPKTTTGKLKKAELRERYRDDDAA